MAKYKDKYLILPRDAMLAWCMLSPCVCLFVRLFECSSQAGTVLKLLNVSVLFCSRPRSKGWPHHGRTFSIYLCPLSFWLTLSQGVLSTCPTNFTSWNKTTTTIFLKLFCFPAPTFTQGYRSEVTDGCWPFLMYSDFGALYKYCIIIIVRSTLQSRPITKPVSNVHPSVRPYVCLSTNGFFDFNEIWHVGRGRKVMHDNMLYDPIQDKCQGQEPFKVENPSIFKSYLLRHLQWEPAIDHWFLK